MGVYRAFNQQQGSAPGVIASIGLVLAFTIAAFIVAGALR
jgi:hypothetical protein